nr:transposase [Polaribacter porphyrae]
MLFRLIFWFYGFKLYIITNDTGGIIDFMITKGNVDDRKRLRFKTFIKKLYGKLFGDKGYISKSLFTHYSLMKFI